MGYMTNGLTFNTLRAANLKRLPMFKDAKGRTCHAKDDGSDWSPALWLQAVDHPRLGTIPRYFGDASNRRRNAKRHNLKSARDGGRR
jgi:hypothetical protein